MTPTDQRPKPLDTAAIREPFLQVAVRRMSERSALCELASGDTSHPPRMAVIENAAATSASPVDGHSGPISLKKSFCVRRLGCVEKRSLHSLCRCRNQLCELSEVLGSGGEEE